jgi:hypothetical protein
MEQHTLFVLKLINIVRDLTFHIFYYRFAINMPPKISIRRHLLAFSLHPMQTIL